MNAGSSAVVANAPDGSASVTVSLKRRETNTTPQSVLEAGAGGSLSKGRELEQSGLVGYTAVAKSGGNAARLAVIEYNGLYYLFEGKAADFAILNHDILTVPEEMLLRTRAELTAVAGEVHHNLLD